MARWIIVNSHQADPVNAIEKVLIQRYYALVLGYTYGRA